uniref:ShKT domain-containing protein n=1 Tax=Gongylonema pulchrum TaxID=637853 RepID=A0A183EA84_9BILA
LTGPDGRSECATYVFLCQHRQYGPLMATECPRTCGHCPIRSRSYHVQQQQQVFQNLLKKFLNAG